MKLGIFDSGLGGLVMARAVRDVMPDIDLLYYGDTLHLPYGNRSDEAIYTYTKRAMEWMFERGCCLIIVACNTASAAALRRMQQTWLPTLDFATPHNIIGVVVPTLEEAIDRGHNNLGLIATNYLIQSNVYEEELCKINSSILIHQAATPLLVSLIENGGEKWISDVLHHYLDPLLAQDIECLILGCTHYPAVKDQVRSIIGQKIDLISQDDIIPGKLIDYLDRHPKYKDQIGHSGLSEFFVSDLTQNYKEAARRIYGEGIEICQSS